MADLVNISIPTAGGTALLGYLVVFFGLVLLMIVLLIMGSVFEKAQAELGDTARCEEDVLSYIAFPPVAEKFFAERKAREERLCRYSIEAVEE